MFEKVLFKKEKKSLAILSGSRILKSLYYFEDADKDPMPKMIETVEWREVKKFFQEATKKVSKKLLK